METVQAQVLESGKAQAGWNRKRRLLAWLNTFLAVAILFGILVGINILAKKYYWRRDFTAEQSYALSDETKNVLKRLTKEKEISVYLNPLSIPGMTPSMLNQVWQRVSNLLEEYKAHSRYFTASTLSEEDPLFRTKLKGTSLQGNDIVFVCGEKTKTVSIYELYDYHQSEQEDRVTKFRAEDAFTAALKEVMADSIVKVYFTTGHGELSLEDYMVSGLAAFAQTLRREGYQVEPLQLVRVNKVPDDCAVLLMIGPKTPVLPEEQTLLKNYLEKGGRLFITLLPETECGLENFLQAWGVQYGKNVLIDDAYAGRGIPFHIVVDQYPRHLIHQGMEGYNTVFFFSCTVEPHAASDAGLHAQELLSTNRESIYAKTDLSFLSDPSKRIKFEPGKDRTGNFPLAVTVEAEIGKGKKKVRLIAFGSSYFLINQLVQNTAFANKTYALNCVRWLLEKESEVTIPPKTFAAKAVFLKPNEQTRIFWFSIALIPSIGIILGLVTWLRRRR